MDTGPFARILATMDQMLQEGEMSTQVHSSTCSDHQDNHLLGQDTQDALDEAQGGGGGGDLDEVLYRGRVGYSIPKGEA